MSRPRIDFAKGRWTLSDKSAGYMRELELAELEHLIADAAHHIELTLRTACVRPPKAIARSVLAKRFRKLVES